MNKLPVITILALALVAVVTGCGGRASYDQRLIAADSLMLAAPDSALAAIMAIDTACLHSEGDRAYRDLLLIQARYKCYKEITAADDSAINHALDYYRAHNGEREKLTRSCLYKGAVMEELGRIDSAMYYYKTAEAVADEKDYANLGQINTRIADLYRLYFADSQTCYHKFKQALGYYKLTGNKRLQFDCLFNMAGCSGVTHSDDPEELLGQATRLANELNDSLGFFKCQELLCRQLYYQGRSLSRAKAIAFNCLNNYRRFLNNNLLLDLADIYAYSGMPDSARFYLQFVNENIDAESKGQIRTRTNMVLSRIARLEGDTALSNHYDKFSHQISDSILNDKQKYVIQQIENANNAIQSLKREQTIQSLNHLIICLIILAILALLAFLLLHYRRIRRVMAIVKELQHSSVNTHEEFLEQIGEKDTAIEQFVRNLVDFIQTTIESTEHNSPTVTRERIKQSIGRVTDDRFWTELQTHLDREHDNFFSKIAQNPRITTSDLHFIELLCCGFNYVEIAIVMDYAPNYISQKRKDIARKLHIREPLQDYLEHT